MTGLGLAGIQLFVRKRRQSGIRRKDVRIDRPGLADGRVRRDLPQCGCQPRGIGVDIAEEMRILHSVFVEVAGGQEVVRVLSVAVAVFERTPCVAGRYGIPPYPVHEQGEARIFGGYVFARCGLPRVEEIEVRPRVRAHAISGHAHRQPAVVAGASVAVVQHFARTGIALPYQPFGEFVAEAVAVGGKPRVPWKRTGAVPSGWWPSVVKPLHEGLAFSGLYVINMLQQRHDYRLALVVRKSFENPVVRTCREDAVRGIPVYRPAVAVGRMVGFDAHAQHFLRLFQIPALAGHAPGESALRRFLPPVPDGLYRRGRKRVHRSVVRAYGLFGIAVAYAQKVFVLLADRRFRQRPRLDGRPGVAVEEHPRMVAPDLGDPGIVVRRSRSHTRGRGRTTDQSGPTGHISLLRFNRPASFRRRARGKVFPARPQDIPSTSRRRAL